MLRRRRWRRSRSVTVHSAIQYGCSGRARRRAAVPPAAGEPGLSAGRHKKQMDSYDVVKQLAKGGQGITSLVKLKTNTSFASAGSKLVLKQTACKDIKAGNEALKEAKFLQKMRHTSVVQYHDVFLHSINGYLVICTVMELCNRGDLAHYLQDKRRRSSPLTEQVMATRETHHFRFLTDKLVVLNEKYLRSGHKKLVGPNDRRPRPPARGPNHSP